MSLLPSADLSDSDVAGVLERAVTLVNPVVNVITRFDPLGLRRRTRRTEPATNAVGKSLDLAAAVVDFARLPGTRAWEQMDRHGHTTWWVNRVGAVTTVLVAFPGALGVIADRLPIQDFLGFSSQALILCGLAREDGITDREDQMHLLGAVLLDRELTDDAPRLPRPHNPWQLIGTVRAVGAELAKRPHPRKVYHYLGMLPAVGAVVDYLGEFGALRHAAHSGQAWLSQQAVARTGRSAR